MIATMAIERNIPAATFVAFSSSGAQGTSKPYFSIQAWTVWFLLGNG